MPSLNDLKNNGNEPFIPHVVAEDDTVVTQESLANNTVAPKPAVFVNVRRPSTASTVSMSSGEEKREMVKANFADLPKREEPGVIIKESIQKDILGPGGIFDDYVKEKKQEMQKDLEAWQNELELNGYVEDENGKLVKKEELEAAENGNKSKALSEIEELERDNSDVPDQKVSSTPIDIFSNNKVEENMDENTNELYEEDFNDEETEIEPPEKDYSTEYEENESGIEVPEWDKDAEYPEVATYNTESDKEVESGDVLTDSDIVMSSTKIEANEEDEDGELEVETENNDKVYESFRKMVNAKLKPVSKKLDIKSFSIAKTADMNNSVVVTSEASIAKWILPNTGVTIMMREFMGQDLDRLRIVMTNNDARGTLQIIYDHISSLKPAFETWLKSIKYDDYDHLFMAVYIASFAGSNYIPIDCANKACPSKAYLTDNIPMTDLVKYKDDAAKAKFYKIYNNEPIMVSPIIDGELIPVTENYAVMVKTPSLYDVMIEAGYYGQEFMQKYASMISISPYIGALYRIDMQNQQLIPIGYKTYVNNDGKTAKSRIIKYSKVFSTFSSDEINMLKAYIERLGKNEDDITYQIPETECPYCKHKTAASETTAAALVFLRNQLPILANSF